MGSYPFGKTLLAYSLLLSGVLSSASVASAMEKSDADMQAVLDKLKAFDVRPIHTLTVPDVRSEDSPADAAMAVQRDKTIAASAGSTIFTKDISIPTKAGNLPARVYIPVGKGPFPVVLYFHGGDWVIADINVYDSTPRALTLRIQPHQR